MLLDTPDAYTETHKQALLHSDSEWRSRAMRGTAPNGISLVAFDAETSRWLGTMGAFVPGEGDLPMLAGVYVASDSRGASAGVSDALLSEVESWARRRANGLTLLVHQNNARAGRFYSRRGFVATGQMTPYILNPDEIELEMAKLW